MRPTYALRVCASACQSALKNGPAYALRVRPPRMRSAYAVRACLAHLKVFCWSLSSSTPYAYALRICLLRMLNLMGNWRCICPPHMPVTTPLRVFLCA